MVDIRGAIQEGRLKQPFTAADVRQACPGWNPATYGSFLPKHRVGNPGGYTPYFVRESAGRYRLRHDSIMH